MDVWAATICFNTVEAQKRGLPKPESWKDLRKTIYKGAIVMPHPASSGTGYLDVAATGPRAGSRSTPSMKNIAQYVHSGSKPGKQAGAGESLSRHLLRVPCAPGEKSGAPVELVFPKEGLGWDIEATGVMKTTKKIQQAQRLAGRLDGQQGGQPGHFELVGRSSPTPAWRRSWKPGLPGEPR